MSMISSPPRTLVIPDDRAVLRGHLHVLQTLAAAAAGARYRMPDGSLSRLPCARLGLRRLRFAGFDFALAVLARPPSGSGVFAPKECSLAEPVFADRQEKPLRGLRPPSRRVRPPCRVLIPCTPFARAAHRTAHSFAEPNRHPLPRRKHDLVARLGEHTSISSSPSSSVMPMMPPCRTLLNAIRSVFFTVPCPRSPSVRNWSSTNSRTGTMLGDLLVLRSDRTFAMLRPGLVRLACGIRYTFSQ